MRYEMNVHRIVRQKKGDNQYIESHVHPFFHYIYILNGSGTVEVDGHRLEMERYGLVLVPIGVMHAIYGKKDLICMDLKFSCDEKLTSLLMETGYYVKRVTVREDGLIQDIFDEAVKAQPFHEHMVNVKFLELIFSLLRRKRDGIEMKYAHEIRDGMEMDAYPDCTGKIQHLLAYIHGNLDKPLKSSELAGMAGYNEAYFSTLFKKYTGYSPGRYVNLAKIERAKEKMLYTTDSVTEISEKLGYESVHYFSKVFKQVTGISPSVYMNRSKVNLTINVQKDSEYALPEGEYEIPIKEKNIRRVYKLEKR